MAVRQAMAYAIDRQRASTIGEYGYEPASNQSGIVTPTFSSWLDTSQAAAFGNNYAYNTAKAISILSSRRLQEGPGRDHGQGRPEAVVQHHQQRRLLRLGGGRQRDRSRTSRRSASRSRRRTWRPPPTRPALYNGNYELGYGSETGGPTPYYELRQWLYSGNSAAIGQPAGSNWERYSSPATDALINSYASTTDPATQHSIVSKLQQVMLQQVPVIPVTESVDWYQYDTGSFSGWVTQSNPYAQPAAYNYPDWGQMMMNLQPK